MAISVLDCTGCGVCVGQCPAKEKALTMTKLDNVMPEGARKLSLIHIWAGKYGKATSRACS